MENQFFKGTFRKVHGLTVLLWIICSLANATDVTVFPDLIIFDYDSTSNSSDALTVRNATGSVADIPEYYPFDSRNNPVAYIKNQANRKIWVRFGGNYQGTVHLLLKLSVSSGNGIGTICNLFIPNYDISSGNYKELQLAGYLPNWVGKHTFTWKWEIYAIPVNTSGYCAAWDTTYTTHTCYTVLAVPQAPMAQPWTSVLDYACVWASGQTSSSTVAEKVVQGLYNNSGFKYDVVDGGPSRYSGKYSTSFDLRSMLSEIGGNNIIVNCYDMGKSTMIFVNALGCNSNYAVIDYFGFVNCIKPIGRDWANNPLYNYGYPYSPYPIVDEDVSTGRSYFQNHAFCLLGSDVYDACLKADTDSNPDAPPHEESWVTGWTWGYYKSKVIDNNPSPPNGTSDPVTYGFDVY